MRHKFIILICLVFVNSGIFFAQTDKKNSSKKIINIGLIGRISTNPVYIAAYAGARLAAKELGKKYTVEIVVDWQTPEIENVQAQEDAIKRLTRSHADGIAIACSDPKYLAPVIDETIKQGIPIMCFNSDAPKSKRFAYYGSDDIEFGKMLMKQLATELEGKGTIAVLAGPKNSLTQKQRLQGIKEELEKYPNITLHPENVYHNLEIPERAVETVVQAQKANPKISGWIFQGSWPLLVKNGIKWKPGEVKVVAGNAVPEELDYVERGYVQSLVGVNCFQSGYKSVEILIDKILYNQLPANPNIYIKPTQVSNKNLDEWSLNWKKWLLKEAVNR